MAVLIGLLLLVMPMALWGTGQKESGPVKLTIAGRDGGYGKAMEIAVKKYEKQNPDVEILKLLGAGLYENFCYGFYIFFVFWELYHPLWYYT